MRLTGIVGAFLAGCVCLIGIFAPLIAPYSPLAANEAERLQPPSAQHLFGTDLVGRDVFSRVVYGSRISLIIAAATLLGVLVIGLIIGTIAGLSGGLIDEILMRLTDIFLAFPALVLAMAINAAMGPGLLPTIFAISLAWWPGYARMVRAQVLTTRNNTYVEAAYAIGSPAWRVVVRHILPNCMSPILVQLSLDAGAVVVMAAGLSFIGLGVPPPTPEWGQMVSEGEHYILSHWWISTFPGLVMCVFVIGLNMVGDFLRDVSDPRRKRRTAKKQG